MYFCCLKKKKKKRRGIEKEKEAKIHLLNKVYIFYWNAEDWMK